MGFSAETDLAEVPWKDAGVDIVLECTGKFRAAQALAPYFERGVQKVIVAAPVKDGRAQHRHGRQRPPLSPRASTTCSPPPPAPPTASPRW